MAGDGPFAEPVQRHRIAVATAIGTWHIIEQRGRVRFPEAPRGQQIDTIATGSRPAVVGWTPHVVGPLDNRAGSIDCSTEPNAHRRAERRPAQFIGPTPQAHDRGIAVAREQRRVEGDIVSAVVAVAARSLRMNDPHLLRRDTKRARQRSAQRMHALGMRPYRQRAIVPLGNGATWANRGMGQIRAGVSRLVPLHVVRDGGLIGDECGALRRQAVHPCIRVGQGRQRTFPHPLRALARDPDGVDGLVVAASDHTHETAVGDDIDDTGKGGDSSAIERLQPVVRMGGTQHPAVQHAGQGHVLDEGRAVQLGVEVEPPQAIVIDTAAELIGWRQLRAGAVQVHFGGELPIADAFIARRAHEDAGANHQVSATEDGTCLLLEQRADQRAGPAHGGSAMLHREAAGGIALIRRDRGIGGSHPDVVEVDAELLGRDCRNRSDGTLADLHLAGAQRHDTVIVERHPLVEAGIGFEAEGELGHARPRSAMARSTARRIRTCAPHRHRCRSSSTATISLRLAGGFRASNPVTVMMMPLMQ